MTPDERRDMIVRAALPLVGEYGTAVTTAQIARAAGIGEATIFRVFDDKEALLDACVVEALRTDRVVAEIRAIPLDQPLPARLAEAAAALDGYLARMGAVLGSLHATGRQLRHRGTGAVPDRAAAGQQTREAVAELLEPDRASLRLPPEQLASIFVPLVFARGRAVGGEPPATSDLLDLFLHGALLPPR